LPGKGIDSPGKGVLRLMEMEPGESVEEPGATCVSQGADVPQHAGTQVRPCKVCGETKPLDEFPIRHSHNNKPRYRQHTCKVCYRKHKAERQQVVRNTPEGIERRRAANQRRRERTETPERRAERLRKKHERYFKNESPEHREARLERKREKEATRRAAQRDIHQSPLAYRCDQCHDVPVSKEGALCRRCRVERRSFEYAAHEIKSSRAAQAVRRDRDPSRYIQIGDDEWLLLIAQCARCRKKIALAGYCYGCATGGQARTYADRQKEKLVENAA